MDAAKRPTLLINGATEISFQSHFNEIQVMKIG